MYVTGGGISPLAVVALVIGLLFFAEMMLSALFNEISRKPYLLIFLVPIALPIIYVLSKRHSKHNKLCEVA